MISPIHVASSGYIPIAPIGAATDGYIYFGQPAPEPPEEPATGGRPRRIFGAEGVSFVRDRYAKSPTRNSPHPHVSNDSVKEPLSKNLHSPEYLEDRANDGELLYRKVALEAAQRTNDLIAKRKMEYAKAVNAEEEMRLFEELALLSF